MKFVIGKFQIDIDVEKTRGFYNSANYLITDGCSCDACCNYRQNVDCFPDEVKDFFAKIGVDLKKFSELMPYSSVNNRKELIYGGFYHICGTISDKEDIWRLTSDSKRTETFLLDEYNMYSITENFKIGFTDVCDMLEADFPTPAIQMEIMFTCPWVLDKKNDY